MKEAQVRIMQLERAQPLRFPSQMVSFESILHVNYCLRTSDPKGAGLGDAREGCSSMMAAPPESVSQGPESSEA